MDIAYIKKNYHLPIKLAERNIAVCATDLKQDKQQIKRSVPHRCFKKATIFILFQTEDKKII